MIDVSTKRQTRLPLTDEFVAEDWHPNKDLRTLVYMNPKNRIHRERERDSYPLRQLYLLSDDGKQVPLTNDPAFDNIWSRFAPAGDRIVHYRRRFVDGGPREYAVVRAADGAQAKEVLGFTDLGHKVGLYWYRPRGFPAWSPDGKTIVWLVRARTEREESIGSFELVLIPAHGGSPRRISLGDLGLEWVSAVDWR